MKEKLAQLLEACGMRPSQLARAAGLTTSTVDDILKGKTNELNIGVDKMLKIAAVLGVSVESLYEREIVVNSHNISDLSFDEQELLKVWREATDAAKESALMVLKSNKRPLVKKEEVMCS